MLKEKRLSIVTGLVVLIILSVTTGYLYYRQKKNGLKIANYDECVREGGIVKETFPPRCEYKGKTFTPATFKMTAIDFQEILKGQNANYSESSPMNKVIDNENDFNSLWTNILQQTESKPKIDFSKEMVIAAFYGQKSNGGYSIEIKEIRKSSKPEVSSTLEVDIKYAKPGPSCMTTQAITSPFSVIKLEKPENFNKDDIAFTTIKEEVRNCK